MAEESKVIVKNYNVEKAGDIVKMADTLKSHIVKHNLYSNIKGKNYVEVEGWQFAGGMLGLMPRVSEVKDLSVGEEIKWQAEVEIVRISDDKVVARGFSICSGNEMRGGKKVRDEEYAIQSMAQTRAIGKAYRTCLSWVMKMAGYEGTPSEEMSGKVVPQQDGETVIDITDPDAMVDEAVNKIGRMRSLNMLDQVEENITNSKKYNADQKKTIKKAISEKRKEIEKK